MYPVSFMIIISFFYNNLELERIISQIIFEHSLERLTDINFLSADILESFHPVTAEQLKYCALKESHQKEK